MTQMAGIISPFILHLLSLLSATKEYVFYPTLPSNEMLSSF